MNTFLEQIKEKNKDLYAKGFLAGVGFMGLAMIYFSAVSRLGF